MRRPHHRGYVRGGPGEEADLVGCGHCSASIEVRNPGQPSVAVEFCRCCMRFVCSLCAVKMAKPIDDGGGCVTWERMLEGMEARGRLLKEIGTTE